MIAWINANILKVLAWMLCISWFFHVYLLVGAAFRGDTAARNWELALVVLHHLGMVAIVIYSNIRKRRRGSI